MKNSLKSKLVSVLGAGALLLSSSCNKSANNVVYDNSDNKDILGLSEDEERGEEKECLNPNAILNIQKYLYRNQKDLLNPNYFIRDFPGRAIYFDRRDGDTLYNLLVLEESDQGTREFRAETAEIEGGEDSAVFLSMHNVRISPYASGVSGVASVDRLKYLLPDLSLTFSNNNSRASD